MTTQKRNTMNKPEFFVTPGYGEYMLNKLHYSQAVKIGDRVETSGQGGWDDDLQIPESIADEIAQAFRNVERTLATAGASWEDVIHVNSYHVGGLPPEVNKVMVELYRHYMPDRAPIWTQVGVAALGLSTMRIEIRVTAIIN
jgi:enamine deaminase RidA (YjgF/YER057c/UK114 family)